MNTGMLWIDTSHTALAVKVQKAAEYYEKKYNRRPNLCLVNPSLMDGSTDQQDGITIKAYRPVLPGHLWIGVEDRPLEPAQEAE